MKGVAKELEKKALENANFRLVIETGKYTQVVVMSITPGEEIGEEVHADTDQVLYFVSGTVKAVLDGQEQELSKGDAVLVNAGTKHNFINIGHEDLKIITTYSPPHHPEDTIHKTKEEADKANY